MSNPPEFSEPMSAIWQQIIRIPRPSREVDFPRVDPATGETVTKVVMRVLAQEDLQNSAAEAEKYARQKLKEFMPRKDDAAIGYENLYNNEVSVQLLARAMYRLEDPTKPFAPSPKFLRTWLTQDEVGMLMRSYLIVQAELGPVVSAMDTDEMEGWVKRLVEGASAHPLALLSSEGLTDLIMHMARRLHPYLTGTSLPGSQQSDSPEPSPDPMSLENTEPELSTEETPENA